jgi:hypothetical protein
MNNSLYIFWVVYTVAQLVEALYYKPEHPNSASGIFHWHKPSSHAMDLGLTQPQTEMSTRNNSWPVLRTDNLTTFMYWLSWNLGPSTSWNPQDLSRPVMRLLYPCMFQALLAHLQEAWHKNNCYILCVLCRLAATGFHSNPGSSWLT